MRPPKTELPEPKQNFLRGEPRVATEYDVNARWCGYMPGVGFRCAFCGYKLQVGDYWRCQYTNSTPGASGNPFTCVECDDEPEKLIAKWKAKHKAWSQMVSNEYWWFKSLPY